MAELVVIPEGKVYDYIDGKFRNDTPGEYVQQNIEKRLVNEHKYSKDRIAVEFTVNIGSRKPRADIVIFSHGAPTRSQEHVHVIIECKKEAVLPTAKKDGVGQLQSYMAACPNCEWGMWTNGIHCRYVIASRPSSNAIFVPERVDEPGQFSALLKMVDERLPTAGA
jgi:type I restriction enzyme M protein